MDAGAIWTAAGVVTGAVVLICGVLVSVVMSSADVHRKRAGELEQRISEMERQKTDLLLRLAECEHERRNAEQTVANLRAVEELSYRRNREAHP